MKFKPRKKQPKNGPYVAPAFDEGYPHVYLRASKEQLNAVEVGEEATIVLKVKVTGQRINVDAEFDNVKRSELEFEVHESEVYAPGDNEYMEMSKDEG